MRTTVIVPTFNEADNAVPLLTRLEEALRGRDAEVLFVDDGTDDLPGIVSAFATVLDLPVRVIRRDAPVGRLGGAVVEGIRRSDGDVVVVMDGDLQHPPELIPRMLDELLTADLVVASRYTAGGDAAGLGTGLRRLVSRATGALSRTVFPQRLKRCSDPMSGFFAVHRDRILVDALRPGGFKILLEIVGRSRPLALAEVPFTFGRRTAGSSHAGAAEGMRFLRQLLALRLSTSSAAGRAALFMLVGMSGVLPNLAVLTTLVHQHVHYLLAAILAIQVSIVWNFVGAELLVWRDRAASHRWRSRFAQFLAVGETDLLRLPFVYLLVDLAGLGSLTATLLTVGAAFALRFTLADKIVYRRAPLSAPLTIPAEIVAEPAA